MFNLLMQYRPWNNGRDTISRQRLFEFTNDNISSGFKNGEDILLDRLILLPCLFMQEGTDSQLAYPGIISRAQVAGDDISIEYFLEPDIAPILNSTIYEKKVEFGFSNEFEFSRTHWAVKDIDLFRTLLRNFQPRRQRPSVFEIPENEKIEPALVSVMMPFDAQYLDVYNCLRTTADSLSLRCRRADEIWENPAVIQDIVSLIDKSRIVICDCTGRNPNVFYEIGIAHTLGREVILITQNAADIPFDLRHLRYVQYLNNAEGRIALSTSLTVARAIED